MLYPRLFSGNTNFIVEIPSTVNQSIFNEDKSCLEFRHVNYNNTKVFVKLTNPFERIGSELLMKQIVLAQIGIGVKVLGYFDEGIIEEYYGVRT